jgi:apolipoprotein N-acyltransferase
VLNNHVQRTRELARRVRAGELPRPELVVWPENSSDLDPYADPEAKNVIDGAVKDIGVPVLVGAVVDSPDGRHVENRGIVWDPVTGPGAYYVKRHPVPFGEYLPFRDILTKLITRFERIPRDFAQGARPGLLRLGPAQVGDVICFEVAYDGLVRDVASSELLVVQTNNATYTGTGQLEQQFAISRYRAIETGRYVVVAATNGISGIIAPDGTVVARTEQRTQEVLDEQVELGDGITLGLRIGLWVELALCGLAVATVVANRLGRRRSPAKIEA